MHIKKKVVNYLETSDFSDIEKMYIYGTQYSYDNKQKSQFDAYMKQVKATGRVTSSEVKDIYKKLQSVEELENGRIRWK